MTPKRSDEVLAEWLAITRTATPPGAPPRAATASVAGPGISLAGATVLVVAVVAAIAWLGNREGPGPGAVSSPMPAPSVALATPTPTTKPTPSPTSTPTPPGNSELVACDGPTLAARITLWEGAAGSRIAHVEMTNAGSSPCTVDSVTRTWLVDGSGTGILEGERPSGAETITIPAGASFTTLVAASNYCGPSPVPPIGVAFDVGGVATVLAKPPSDTDATVPPCNGPGQAGTIQMQPWSGG